LNQSYSILVLTDNKIDYLARYVINSLEKTFNATIENQHLNLDISPFINVMRNQVNALKLLNQLNKEYKGNPLLRIIAILDEDAYIENFNFIFGLARNTWGGIVFTKRLRPEFYGMPHHKRLFIVRVIKEVIHELGHSYGLTHCPSRKCVMRYSNTVWEVDEKTTYFCPSCRLKLETHYLGLIK